MKLVPGMDQIGLTLRSTNVPHSRLVEEGGGTSGSSSSNGHPQVHAIAFSNSSANGVSFSGLNPPCGDVSGSSDGGARSKTKLWRRLLHKCGRLPNSTSHRNRKQEENAPHPPVVRETRSERLQTESRKRKRVSSGDGVRRALSSVFLSKYLCGSCVWCWLRRGGDSEAFWCVYNLFLHAL